MVGCNRGGGGGGGGGGTWSKYMPSKQNTKHTDTHMHTHTQTHTHSQTPSRQTSDAAILPRLFLVESLEVFLKHVLIHDAEGRPVVVLLQLAVAGKLGWL